MLREITLITHDNRTIDSIRWITTKKEHPKLLLSENYPTKTTSVRDINNNSTTTTYIKKTYRSNENADAKNWLTQSNFSL